MILQPVFRSVRLIFREFYLYLWLNNVRRYDSVNLTSSVGMMIQSRLKNDWMMEKQETTNVTGWIKLMSAILNLPGAKVDRVEFLVKALRPHCTDEEIKKAALQRPIDVISEKLAAKIADEYITKETEKATLISTVTGIPGGASVFVAIPIDLVQYYYHTVIIAQKLAYLYGYPDLRDRTGKMKPSAYGLLLIFLGVMLGSDASTRAVKKVARTLSQDATSHLPQVNVPAVVWLPIAESMSKWIRGKVFKRSLTKRLIKAVPMLGGVVTGCLTYMSFKPNAKRLQKVMAEDALLFKNR